MTHTRPYRIDRDEDGVLCITDANGQDVAKVTGTIADRDDRMQTAEFIVRACNAYRQSVITKEYDLITTNNFDEQGLPRFATDEERSQFNVDTDGRLILWRGAKVLLGSNSSDW